MTNPAKHASQMTDEEFVQALRDAQNTPATSDERDAPRVDMPPGSAQVTFTPPPRTEHHDQ